MTPHEVLLAVRMTETPPDPLAAEQVIAAALTAGRAEALEEAERMRSAVTSGLAELARMDRVPCRHYRECSCREVLDREQVMTELMAIKRALAGKL